MNAQRSHKSRTQPSFNLIHSPTILNPTIYYRSTVGKAHAIHSMDYTQTVNKLQYKN